MKIVTEEKKGKTSVFHVKEVIGPTLVRETTSNVQIVKVDIDGTTGIVLYNSNHEVIRDAFMFLNHRKKNVADNTREKDAYALRFLYSFAEIFSLDIKEFTHEDFTRLAYFLQGQSADTNYLELNLLTKRRNDSVNSMFSTYRTFYRYLRMESPVLRDRSFASYIKQGKERRVNPLSPDYPSKEVPKYISKEEFKRIVVWIRENITDEERRLRDEVIVRIMYEGGLRLGEVLGSTLEDYVVEPVKKGSEEEICFVYIRNRFSDQPFQSAKGCIKIYDRKQYQGNEYMTQDIGYQLSFLSLDTYDLLCEYIDLAHERAYNKCRKQYDKYKADAVGDYKIKNKENYYLFLNQRGTPLSNTSWNQELRFIFKNVGINVDYGVKRNNLSHRFRHGFIMNLILNEKLPREMVKVRSRHKSSKSLDA